MHGVEGRDVLIRGNGRFHMGHDMGCVVITRFTPMDLVPSPAVAPFFALA
jgi:hypothetical protein